MDDKERYFLLFQTICLLLHRIRERTGLTCVRRRPCSAGNDTSYRPCGVWRGDHGISCVWRVAGKSCNGTASRRRAPVKHKTRRNQSIFGRPDYFQGFLVLLPFRVSWGETGAGRSAGKNCSWTGRTGPSWRPVPRWNRFYCCCWPAQESTKRLGRRSATSWLVDGALPNWIVKEEISSFKTNRVRKPISREPIPSVNHHKLQITKKKCHADRPDRLLADWSGDVECNPLREMKSDANTNSSHRDMVRGDETDVCGGNQRLRRARIEGTVNRWGSAPHVRVDSSKSSCFVGNY